MKAVAKKYSEEKSTAQSFFVREFKSKDYLAGIPATSRRTIEIMVLSCIDPQSNFDRHGDI